MSREVDHAPDPVLCFQQVEAAVDVVQRELVRDVGVHVDVPGEIHVHELRNLVASLDSAERRARDPAPVIRKRGMTSNVSPLPATPHIVARPQPMRADSTAWRMTFTLPVASNV